MIRPSGVVLILMTLLPVTARSARAQSATADTAEVSVRSVVERLGRGLAEADSLGVLRLLHDDVIVYEGGHAETKEQYRSGHVRSDIAFAAAVKRTTLSDRVIVSGDMAVYTSTYRSVGRFRNRDVNSEGTETIVLTRMRDGWKIRHIHW